MEPAAILDIDGTLVDTNYQHARELIVDKAGGGEGVMIGDSTWDCELREAGAAVVFESIEDLRERVGQTPLGDGQATRELPRQA